MINFTHHKLTPGLVGEQSGVPEIHRSETAYRDSVSGVLPSTMLVLTCTNSSRPETRPGDALREDHRAVICAAERK